MSRTTRDRVGPPVRVWIAVAAATFLAVALLAGCSSTSETSGPASSPDAPKEGTTMFTLSSPAFEGGGLMPVEHANTGVSGGENVSVAYEWRGAPEGTRSFALVLVDRYPAANSWVHWMVTGIPATTEALARGASGGGMPAGAVEHSNTFGKPGYGGPQPPAGSGRHEYEAVVYALDTDKVALAERASLGDFNTAIDGHVLASARYSGLFGR